MPGSKTGFLYIAPYATSDWQSKTVKSALLKKVLHSNAFKLSIERKTQQNLPKRRNVTNKYDK